MATIRKREDRWQALVRRQGCRPLSRTFSRRSDAVSWGAQVEAEIDQRGLPIDRRSLDHITVGDLVQRYRGSVVVAKRSREIETIILDAFARRPLAREPLSGALRPLFTAYRDERLYSVKPGTVRRELGLLQHMFSVAMREWGIPLAVNPLASVAKPKAPLGRDRRLDTKEQETLLAALDECRNPYVKPLVLLAMETGMRQGELLRIRPTHYDHTHRTLLIPTTKNGHARTIPLSTRAMEMLDAALAKKLHDEALFPVTGEAIKRAWKRATRRAGIKDLHFHDLRHEAISRFFERGLNLPEVALISGHRDPRMLLRYTHLKAESVAAKLG